MALYFALFFIPLAFLSVLDFAKLSKSYKNFIYILACIFTLVFTMIVLNASGDYVNYEIYYKTMAKLENYYPKPNEIATRYEPGFAILNILVNKIAANPYIGIAIITSIGIVGFFCQLPKYSNAIFLMLAIYIGHFYWWFGIVLIRQTIAMALLFPIMHFVYEKKLIKTILLILAATCFHYSSVVFLLVLPLLNLNISNKTSAILVCGSFIVGFFGLFEAIATAILQYIPRGEVFINYLISNKKPLNILYLIEILAIVFISLYYKHKLLLQNKYTNIAINYLLIAAVIAGLFQHYEIASRFITFFCFGAYLILLPTLTTIFKNGKSRISYYAILNLYLLVFLVRLIAVTVK